MNFYFVFARNASHTDAAAHAGNLPPAYKHSDKATGKAAYLRIAKSANQRRKLALWVCDGERAKVAF